MHNFKHGATILVWHAVCNKNTLIFRSPPSLQGLLVSLQGLLLSLQGLLLSLQGLLVMLQGLHLRNFYEDF